MTADVNDADDNIEDLDSEVLVSKSKSEDSLDSEVFSDDDLIVGQTG